MFFSKTITHTSYHIVATHAVFSGTFRNKISAVSYWSTKLQKK